MKILIIANQANSKTVDALYQLVAFLESQSIDYATMDVSELPDAAFPYCGKTAQDLFGTVAEEVDLVVTLGGDGTILHASRLSTTLHAPIIGLNFGHLGFLTNTAQNGVIALIADALSGEIAYEERVNLCVTVQCEGDDTEPIENPREFYALNEIAIARGALGHIVDFDFSVSGDKIASLRGDGLVVSTATGSTAYALAAGGPLVGPLHRGMIVAPLVPHTLNSRAIVTEHNDVVEVTFEPGSSSASEVSLFADGDALVFERPLSSVTVKTGEHPTILLNHHDQTFYKKIAETFFK